MKKIIGILAAFTAMSVNAADPFSSITPGGFVAPTIAMPRFTVPAPTFAMPSASSVIVYKPVAVSAYTTTAGTYVAPHFRSAPNATQADNYSAKGFVNPFTGVAGTVKPVK